MGVVFAVSRANIADYVDALFWVYSLLLIAYVVTSMFFSLGGRIPYSRWSNALLGFLRDVSEPYLSVFRRILPMAGPFDFSPMLALIVLYIVRGIVVRAIQG
jgi:YggT family protein